MKRCKNCYDEIKNVVRTTKRYCSTACNMKYYRAKNKDVIKKQRSEYYQRHIDQEKASCKRWYAKNRESEIAKNKAYREQNRELFNWYHNKERFGGIKDLILERDNHSCRLCQTKRKTVVHHIDGKNYQNSKIVNNDFNNLIVLCSSCHHKLHWWQWKNHQLESREDIVRTMGKLIEAGSKSLR